MRICIYGAGAVGGMLGGELARVGHDVTLIGRGAHIEAVRAKGLTVDMHGDVRHTSPAVATDPAEAGRQDLVIMLMKGHHVPAAATRIAPLLGPDTPVVAAQNGIPWWYFYKIGGAHEGRTLAAVDPGRIAWTAIGPERVLGGVLYGSCEVIEPGFVRHEGASRSMVVGEPDGSISPRAREVAEAFAKTDVKIPVTDDIRRAVWIKLMANLSGSVLNALTRSTVVQLSHDDGCQPISANMLRELAAVASSLGVDLASAVEARLEAPRSKSQHKTSLLQDLERGRPMEIDPIAGAVAEMGRLTGTKTPWIDAMYALIRLLAETTGAYAPNAAFRLAVA